MLKTNLNRFKDIPSIYRQMLAGRDASCNAAEVKHAKRKPGCSSRLCSLPVL